jgi:hypothetical protein
MLTIIEKSIYFILFLVNKYIDLEITEKWLSKFENKMIKKYVPDKPIDATKIPTINVSELTDELFNKISNNYRRPVLIKGLMKDSTAVKKWNLDYLKETIGDFKINVVSYDSDLEIKEMSFNEFTEKQQEGLYINNNHTILSKFPHLFNDFKDHYMFLLKTLKSTNLKNIHIANLFIGTSEETKSIIKDKKNETETETETEIGNKINTGSVKKIKRNITGSNMHAGGSGNMFVQVIGNKTWTLIDPEYSCILKGRVAQNGIHAQTLFDMPDTDIGIYPTILKYLPRYEVTLEPGDVLWNAPWWWHRIRNHKKLSIGMAIRNNKVTMLNLKNNFTYTLSGYIYLVYNTWTISLYEKYIGEHVHFGVSKQEKTNDNVLYQIDKLVKKYPKSVVFSKDASGILLEFLK